MTMRQNQEGASLLGVIVAVVLILVIGGGAFYGILQFNKDSEDSKDRGARSSVDTSLISSTLRMDLSGAKAARVASEGQRLDIARVDGSCVSWKIAPGASGSDELLRASSMNGAPISGDDSSVTDGVSSGSFGTDSSSASVSLKFAAGHSFDDKINFSNSGNGGGCW